MKTRALSMEDGRWPMRSILSVSASLRRDRAEAGGEGGECGSMTPSLDATCRVVPKCGLVRAFQKLALLCCILLPSAFCLRAQQYSIDWYKVAGGGGTSTNGQYSVSGTIGQPDAGQTMSGGNYSLTGGFWSLIAVVQMPGAPMLYISQSGNTVTVYWQNVSGWNLQQNANLATVNWTASSGVTTANGTNYLNLTSPTGNLFFRLTHP
jgi:hypothetical protein